MIKLGPLPIPEIMTQFVAVQQDSLSDLSDARKKLVKELANRMFKSCMTANLLEGCMASIGAIIANYKKSCIVDISENEKDKFFNEVSDCISQIQDVLGSNRG